MNFKMIEANSVDIETFECNVSELVDNILVGPQGEIIEALETLRERYNCNLGVSKSFTLKPGGYNEIKRAYNEHVLRHDMKPRGVESIFKRIQDYRWRESGFKGSLLNLEYKLKDLKSNGIKWQDNTDQFEEEFIKVKSSIISQLEIAKEMYPHVEIQCRVMETCANKAMLRRQYTYGGNAHFIGPSDTSETRDYIVLFMVKIKNANMRTHIIIGNETKRFNHTIGDVYIASGVFLLPLISRHWGREEFLQTVPPTSVTHFLEALYLDSFGLNKHPYISQGDDRYRYHAGDDVKSNNVCLGSMKESIRTSIMNVDILAHITTLVGWATNYYVPQTNPLNRVSYSKSYGRNIAFDTFLTESGDNDIVYRTFFEGNGNYTYNTLLSCNLSRKLFDEAHDHARNVFYSNYRITNTNSYTVGAEDYLNRKLAYYNHITDADLPCAKCTFNTNCEQYNNISLVLKDNKTPEEEGIIGVMLELSIKDNILSTENDVRIDSIEDSLWTIPRTRERILDSYNNYVRMHRVIIRWLAKQGREPSDAYGELEDTPTYRRKLRNLCNMPIVNFDHFYENVYLDLASNFEWNRQNVVGYEAGLPPVPDNPELTEDQINQIEQEANDILGSGTPFDDPVVTSVPRTPVQTITPEREMTVEERTIQWAIRNGSANNL